MCVCMLRVRVQASVHAVGEGLTCASQRITSGTVLQATSTLAFVTGSLIGLDCRSRLGWLGL